MQHKKRILLIILPLILGLTQLETSAEAANPKLLAVQANRLFKQSQTTSDADQKNAIYYKVFLIFEEIRRDHANTLTGIGLGEGKIMSLDAKAIKAVEAGARAWARKFPERAAELMKQGSGKKTAPVRKVERDTARPGRDDGGDKDTAEKDNGVKGKQEVVVDPKTDTIKIPPTADIPSIFKDRTARIDDRKPSGGQDDYATGKTTRGGVFRRLRDAVVFIVYVAKAGNNVGVFGYATGFFISPTHIMTNAHVAEIALAARKKNYGGFFLMVHPRFGMREIKIVSNARRDTSLKIDAAIMEVNGYRSDHYLTFAQTVEPDEWIATGGFPGKAIKVDGAFHELREFIKLKRDPPLPKRAIPLARTNEGRVSSIFTVASSQVRTLQYSMVTAGGASGSPVVNACGEVVGLHHAGTRTTLNLVKDSSGNIVATGEAAKYNQAVALTEVLDFLRRAGVTHKRASGPCQVG